MKDKLKLIIADDEQFICIMLKNIINFETLGLELLGFAKNGEILLEMIIEKVPDIVITDISMPKLDGLEVIRLAKERGLNCRFIIISGFRHFEYAYNALKYDVEDYILKPIEEDELNATLEKIANSIRRKNLIQDEGDNKAVRAFFIKKAIYELEAKPLSLEDTNSSFGTNFFDGLFRMVELKIDYTEGGVQQIYQDSSSITNKLRNLTTQLFKPVCGDIIFEAKPDGIMALLNYRNEDDKKVTAYLTELFNKGNIFIEMFSGLNLTLCVGEAVNSVSKIAQSKTQVRVAEWARMHYGIGRVIFSIDVDPNEPFPATEKLNEFENKILFAFKSLDANEFGHTMENFFTFPRPILCRKESMLFARKIRDTFFEMYEKLIGEYTDFNTEFTKYRKSIHLAYTFREYKKAYIDQICGIIKQLNELNSSRNSRPIRMACAYIEKNYTKNIGLEEVSREVGLSSSYLSSIFGKQTGKNFTEYLTEYRIAKAKELLKNTNLNVKEIAYSLNFTDYRYFSKLFKKMEGLKPTEYRKMYS